jgi:hypothetical protein
MSIKNTNSELSLTSIESLAELTENSSEKQSIQKPIPQDWINREFTDIIAGSIQRIVTVLNSFG